MMPMLFPGKKTLLRSAAARGTGGFTLVELVVTLIVIGVLAAAMLPRFFDRADFDARAFLDQTAAALRYAQKAAIAQRRTVCVAFTANAVTLTIRAAEGPGACDTPLAGPAGGSPYTVSASGAVGFSPVPAALGFDAEGRPGAGATITFSHTPATLTVTAETGYVVY